MRQLYTASSITNRSHRFLHLELYRIKHQGSFSSFFYVSLFSAKTSKGASSVTVLSDWLLVSETDSELKLDSDFDFSEIVLLSWDDSTHDSL